MTVTDGTTNTRAMGISFERVTTPAPLMMKDEARAMLRDNAPVSIRQHPEQTAQEGLTALYERLSQEDKNDGESNSIANQKRILERYCKEHGYTAIRHYEDDGYSGTSLIRVDSDTFYILPLASDVKGVFGVFAAAVYPPDKAVKDFNFCSIGGCSIGGCCRSVVGLSAALFCDFCIMN